MVDTVECVAGPSHGGVHRRRAGRWSARLWIEGGAVRLAALVLVALCANGAPLYAQDLTGAAADVDVPTASVVVDGVALFSVRGVSALPAAARARLIRDRIEAAAVDRSDGPVAPGNVEQQRATYVRLACSAE